MARSTERGRSILVQGSILAAAGLISRVIGLLYTSPLTAIIGDEGYSTAYYIYTIILLISSYSIPSAMSKLISQKLAVREYRNAQRIFKYAMIYVFVVGGLGSLVLFFGAGLFVHGASIPVLRVFAPTVFIFGPLGVLRGYFQAHRTMVPTSISQIIEQLCNAAVSLGAAHLLTNWAISQSMDESGRAMYGAIGSALGTGSGVVIALIFMFLIYRMNRHEIERRMSVDLHQDMSGRDIIITILSVVTPFILSTFIYNFSTTLNSSMFTRILTLGRGIPFSEVATRFGVFSRKAMVITNLPIAVASALATAIMPNISASYAQGKIHETSMTIDNVNRGVLLVAIPSAVGLMTLSEPVMMLLFPQKNTLGEAAMLLRILAVTVIFYSLSTVSNAVLQGIGKVHTPVVNAALALVIQSVALYLMLSYTDLGNVSLALATILYSGLMCVLNEISIHKGWKAFCYRLTIDFSQFKLRFAFRIYYFNVTIFLTDWKNSLRRIPNCS